MAGLVMRFQMFGTVAMELKPSCWRPQNRVGPLFQMLSQVFHGERPVLQAEALKRLALAGY